MFAPRYFPVRYFTVKYFASGEATPAVPVAKNAVQRTIPANVTAEIVDQHTRPFFIVKLEFAGATSFLSEGREVTFESNLYTEGAIKVGTFKWGHDGSQTGSLSLLNENNAASALVLNNKVDDVAVSIYKVYALTPTTNTDPVFYSRGVMSGSSITPAASIMKVVTSKGDTEFVPSDFYTIAENFNHLPPQGTVVQWAGEKYVLEAVDNA